MTTYNVKDAKIVDGHVYGISITTTRQVKNEVGQVVKDIKITINYDGMPVDQFTLWATSTAVIRQQNQVWKKQSPEEIKAYNGRTLSWDEVGKTGKSSKPSMAATLANIMIANGVPEAKAIERAADIAKDPAKLKAMLEMAGMLSE